MPLISGRKLLSIANKHNFAIGAFNINDMEILQSIIRAAELQNSPVIVQTSEGAIKYAGLNYLFNLVMAAKDTKIPFSLHLDHGRDLELIKKCIKLGYTSIMFDGSNLPFEENAKLTKKVVNWAHKKNIGVEAELGTIGGAEDLVSERKIIYADPKECKKFFQITGCDYLTVAVGTSHGAVKFSGRPNLKINIIKKVKQLTNKPLVLHGASGVPQDIVKLAQKYGAHLKHTIGVPDSQIKKAISAGINKINTDTDLRLAFDAAVRKTLKENPTDFDPRHILGPARDLMQQVVEKRMKLFGSSGKAKLY